MSQQSALKVKIGTSSHVDEEQAVLALYEQIRQPRLDGVIFFCSSHYTLGRLGESLSKYFSCPLIGCTTAGELTASGYHEGTITGASFGGDTETEVIKIHSHMISPLGRWTSEKCEDMADRVRKALGFSTSFNADHMFGFLLIDGLSMQEETIIAHLYRHFRKVPIIGGSAGDDLHFNKTHVYHHGRFQSDAAVFNLIETTVPFLTFKTQHFVPTSTKLVITEAAPEHRRVIEINGEPAAQAYAKILDLKIDQLTPAVFSNHPLILKIGGQHYVRSIQRVNEDGSLTFYCAIDNGLVLTIAQGVGLVDNLRNQIRDIRAVIPNPELIIGCDCILRRLEVQEKALSNDLKDTLKNEKILGFSTYGEQFNAIHVNQTLTGVAIGGTA